MSKIITLSREDRTRALFDDLLLLVKDAAGIDLNEDLSEELKAVVATFHNILMNMVQPNGAGQIMVVPSALVIETAARAVRMKNHTKADTGSVN